METLTDTFLEEQLEKNVKDPYQKAIDILDYVSDHGKTIENENKLLTDGPSKKGKLDFEIKEKLDNTTKFIIRFKILTKEPENSLSLKAHAKLIKKNYSKEDGKGRAIFSEYHSKNILPKHKRMSKKRAQRVIKGLNKLLKRWS